MDNGKELHSESPWVGNYLGMSHAKFNTIHLPRLRPTLPSPPFAPSHHTAYSNSLSENRPANSLRSCACAESSSLAAALSSAVAELVCMMSEI